MWPCGQTHLCAHMQAHVQRHTLMQHAGWQVCATTSKRAVQLEVPPTRARRQHAEHTVASGVRRRHLAFPATAPPGPGRHGQARSPNPEPRPPNLAPKEVSFVGHSLIFLKTKQLHSGYPQFRKGRRNRCSRHECLSRSLSRLVRVCALTAALLWAATPPV